MKKKKLLKQFSCLYFTLINCITFPQTPGSSGRFWSVDQQAHLFPAEISDDSPWKQETANSVLDVDTENRTQEAIDLYFSQHHKISSPEVSSQGRDSPNS
jgi:hypothetical protein